MYVCCIRMRVVYAGYVMCVFYESMGCMYVVYVCMLCMYVCMYGICARYAHML